MMNRSLLFIFLVMLIMAACTQTPPVSMGVPLPPSEDFGVSCFVESGDSIIASAPNFHTYRSTDSGLTWEELPDSSLLGGSDCRARKEPWELWSSPDGMVRYQINPGVNIQLSEDNGANWQVIMNLADTDWQPQNTPEPGRRAVIKPGPLDAMIDPVSGRLLLAMGHAGILLHMPDGEWQWVDTGSYYHGDLSAIQSQVARLKAQPAPDRPSATLLPPDTAIKAHQNYTTTLIFSADGSTLASSGYDGGIKLFAFPSGELQRWQQWGKDRRDSTLYGAVFSADDNVLATCGTNVDKTLHFWDGTSGELIAQYEGFQTSALDSTAFAGRQALAIAYGEDANAKTQIKVFEEPGGDLLNSFDSQVSDIISLKFIPGTSRLMVGGFSGGVELRDIETGNMGFTLQPDQPPDGRMAIYGEALSLGYHPGEDAVMALFGDSRLKAWSASSGELVWSLHLPAPHGWVVSSAAFSANGQMAAVGLQNGALILFDSRDGSPLSTQWSIENGTLMELAFSPDNQWLTAGYASGDLKFWQVSRMVE